MQLDHVYPLSKGGEHSIYNMVVSCKECNLRKSSKKPEKWIEEILSDTNIGKLLKELK